MSEFPWTDETDCAHEHAYAAEAEVRRLRARVFELEWERDEARDSDRESLAMYRRCRADRDALAAKLDRVRATIEREAVGVGMTDDEMVVHLDVLLEALSDDG